MIGMTALLLAASISAAPDDIFSSGVDGDSCPDGRIVQSDIGYGASDVTFPNVDVTLFENLWGRAPDSGPPVSWPGLNGVAPLILDFTKTGYLAAKFHTPSDSLGALTGLFVYNSFPFMGPDLDLSISGQCGDFSAEQSGCVAFDVASADTSLVRWRATVGTPFYCQLQPDTDYYVNVRFSDAAATTPHCSDVDVACPLPGLQSFFAE